MDIQARINELLLEHGGYYTDADRELLTKQYNSEVEQYDSRQRKSIEKAEKQQAKGQVLATSAGRKLVMGHIEAVKGGILEYLKSQKSTGKVKPDAYKLLDLGVQLDCASNIATAILTSVVSSSFRWEWEDKKKKTDTATMQTMVVNIGKSVEANISSNVWEISTHLDRQNPNPFVTLSGRKIPIEKLEPMRLKADKILESTNKAKLGGICLGIVLEKTKLIKKRLVPGSDYKSMYGFEPTDSLIQNIKHFNQMLRLRNSPMVCKPVPWDGVVGGGYLSQKRKVAIIRSVRQPDQLDDITPEQMPKVFNALNAIQSTPWRINEEMLDATQKLWDISVKQQAYGMFTKKALSPEKAKTYCAQVDIALNEAWRFAEEDKIWLPVNMDFRGRVYYQPFLSPQGPDFIRALFDFADAEPLKGDEGFSYYGARLYSGEKQPDAQEKWYEKNFDKIMGNVEPGLWWEWWTEAKDPWQFMKWCFNERRYQNNPDSFSTGMPIYIDASANGIQHFAALLRDEEMAGRVNLTIHPERIEDCAKLPQEVVKRITDKLEKLPRHRGSDVDFEKAWLEMRQENEDVARCMDLIRQPSDIYEEVEAGLRDQLEKLSQQSGSDADYARAWWKEKENIGRNDIKPIVMTIPYGETPWSHTEGIVEIYRDFLEENFTTYKKGYCAAKWLCEQIWEIITEKMPNIKAVPDWLEKIASEYNKLGKHIEWTVPSGFIARQRYFEQEEKRVTVEVGKQKHQLVIKTPTKELHEGDSSRGFMPNLIQSLDASALVETVLNHLKSGNNSIAVIHDAFAVKTGDMYNFAYDARKGFVQTHHNNLLQQYHKHFKEQLGQELTEPPPQGDFDINLVKDGLYTLS